MAIYRGVAEQLVDIYDFDWKDNERMKEACICRVEGLVANVLDIFIVIVFGILTGIFKEVLVFLLSFGFMRFYAGGAHAKNYARCVITYICVMYLSVCLAKQCIMLPAVYTMGICFISIMFSGWINGKYAAKQKNVGSRKELLRRNALIIHKIISVIMIVICISYPYMNHSIWQEIVWIQAFALTAQSIALFMDRKECIEACKGGCRY